jgi:Fe-Mn family superoxide dismutase
LAPIKKGGGAPPTGDLSKRIETQFGSLDAFINKFSAQTAAVQGSGENFSGS